jgi:hypothetical protein
MQGLHVDRVRSHKMSEDAIRSLSARPRSCSGAALGFAILSGYRRTAPNGGAALAEP